MQLLSFKDNQQRKANKIISEKIAIQCLYFKKVTNLNGGMLFNIKWEFYNVSWEWVKYLYGCIFIIFVNNLYVIPFSKFIGLGLFCDIKGPSSVLYLPLSLPSSCLQFWISLMSEKTHLILKKNKITYVSWLFYRINLRIQYWEKWYVLQDAIHQYV